jgi:hypothetical protein
MFKIGDYVKYTGKYSNLTPEMLGKCGIVINVEQGNIEVKWDDNLKINTLGFIPGNLELVIEERE